MGCFPLTEAYKRSVWYPTEETQRLGLGRPQVLGSDALHLQPQALVVLSDQAQAFAPGEVPHQDRVRGVPQGPDGRQIDVVRLDRHHFLAPIPLFLSDVSPVVFVPLGQRPQGKIIPVLRDDQGAGVAMVQEFEAFGVSQALHPTVHRAGFPVADIQVG